MSNPPSTLFGVERSAFEISDRDCRVFKVQVASAPCPPPRRPYVDAVVIADREQFSQSIDLVVNLTAKRVIETSQILSRAAADFGAAAVNSHDLVTRWRSRHKAEPCPDPRTPRYLAVDEELGGLDVMRLEEHFRLYTEQFLCIASQVASLSASARASVSPIGLPTREREPVSIDEETLKREREETAQRLSEMSNEIQKLRQENQRLQEELQKKGRTAS
jgi:hypothetical protein